MQIETDISTHLKNQAMRNLRKGIPYILVFAVLFAFGLDFLPLKTNWVNLIPSVNFLAGVFLTYGLLQFIIPFQHYKMGLDGEMLVRDTISQQLDHEYHLFNDVRLMDKRKGNIDHIIVGPKGVFVVETKNPRRTVTVDGETWVGFSRSPSGQAKSQAVRVYSLLRREDFRWGNVPMVKAVVVLANQKTRSHAIKKQPDNCKILQIRSQDDRSLYDYVMDHKEPQFTVQEIEDIVGILHDSIKED